ncbi:Uu.00g106440.m01.CDS01 [Anthostomella pinea]|uniref:protein-ribulosamine 3-kinase n=1 Tax=Anthostomella pinea TaxID=933095 RepID=A0AAI8VE78_9PEZI|nr:Uu.00g106440.m01.CDS01 [Anthostomella pinea]
MSFPTTQCATGRSARALIEGEYHSAAAISSVVSGFVSKPAGWGKYRDGGTEVYFFIGDYHDMDFSTAPDPAQFGAQLAELHEKGTSPNGMFGYPVPTVCGRMERTVKWEKSWAASFTHQLKDVIKYDNEANDPWPEYDALCKQLIDVVIPRSLGALQSEGREITPALIHGDLWENNIGIDKGTCETVVVDPGKPVDEWDDRNRLYNVHPYLNDWAGHPGSASRQIAYNDMLYLCEKYGPLDSLERYDPQKDLSVTGAYTPFVVSQLE